MEAVPQFEGGGPMVLVRNTFLDIKDAPEPGEIVRSKTAPPASGNWDLDDSDEEEEEDEQPTADASPASPASPTSPDGGTHAGCFTTSSSSATAADVAADATGTDAPTGADAAGADAAGADAARADANAAT
eukprot:Skav202744  [mRNA]  locus=scaffold1326:420146:422622:- [translate_table: standard]